MSSSLPSAILFPDERLSVQRLPVKLLVLAEALLAYRFALVSDGDI